ncbi:MAG TPA: hypothetical protein VF807_00130 [Ktedonobacterales bacterium]
MTADAAELAALVAEVARGSAYQQITPELIEHVGRIEMGKRRTLKEAVKATKSRLHQVAGAYATRRQQTAWLDALRDARAEGPAALRSACEGIMHAHASTRERLPLLDTFYQRTLGALAPVGSVLDLACGLNPLTIPWMPLSPGARYEALDIYLDMAAFLNDALPMLGVAGHAEACDLTLRPPERSAEVALLLKAIPCLDHIERDAGLRLLDAAPARHVLVSYPAQSLGGRRSGRVAHYDARFEALLAQRPWQAERFEFATEIAWLVAKGAIASSSLAQ